MTGTVAQHKKLTIEYRPLSEIRPYERNARKIPQSAIDAVARSLREFGWQQPIVVDAAGVIIVGHVRRIAAIQEGMAEAPVVVAAHLTPAQVRQYRLLDNRSHDESKWDPDILTAELLDMRALDLDLSLTGFGSGELDKLLGQPDAEAARRTLAERFGVPPFSVLDARQGYWQDRKRAWIGLGIQSELGRGENLQGLSESNDEYRYNKAEFFAKVSPGGSPRPAMKLNEQGTTDRGDGHGRPIKRGGVKMAMANDPMQRKSAYDEQKQTAE
jgi:hypothetical protein